MNSIGAYQATGSNSIGAYQAAAAAAASVISQVKSFNRFVFTRIFGRIN
jgi:hypothetical protein